MAWVTDEEVLALKNPTWLIEDLLPESGTAALVGAANIGKTFVGLDMAMCVAAGAAWHGYAVAPNTNPPAPVVYILGEGLGGLRPRVEAWRQVHAIPAGIPVGVHFWDRAVQLAHFPSRQEFRDALRSLPAPPRLIVVDTLARCFVGMDENAAADMGRFVEGMDVLKESGATVLALHHTGHDPRPEKGKPTPPSRERGSSALRGAVDVLHILQRGTREDEIVFVADKVRDARRMEPFSLMLEPVDLPDGNDSLIVKLAPWSPIAMPERWHEALKVLRSAGAGGLTVKEWMPALAGISRATLYRMIDMMSAQRIVTKHHEANRGNVYVYVGGGVADTAAPETTASEAVTDGEG